jgi:hypothetical protein
VNFLKSLKELAHRENLGRSVRKVGFLNLKYNIYNTINVELLPVIEDWARQNGFNSVIWTDLEPRFKETTGKEFTLENAKKYLQDLNEPGAIEYIKHSPVHTKLRDYLQKEGII